MSDANETTYGGAERRRNPMGMVTRHDFEEFKRCVGDYRRDAVRERAEILRALTKRLDGQDQTLTRQDTILARQGELLEKIDTALFYVPDGKRDPTPIGIVHVQRKISTHVDVVCNLGKWLIGGLVAVAPLVGFVGQVLHWW